MNTFKLRRVHVLLAVIFVVIVIPFVIFETVKFPRTHQAIGAKPAASPISQMSNLDDTVQPDNHLTNLKLEGQPAPSTANTVNASNSANNTSNNAGAVSHSDTIFYQNKVAVLTYHHLDPFESSITITPERFKMHLETLKNNGFHVISVEDLIDFLQKKKSVPPNAVVITFDDGYESVYKYAYPILKSEGMTATTFLIVSYVEDGVLHQPPILNWQEIISMHKDGFSFYSHTYNSHESVFKNGKELSELITKLPNPSGNQLESNSEYKTRIYDDFIKADEILNAKLGNQMNLLCLPHGQYNQDVINVANQAQIPFLFTGVEGFNTNTKKSALIKRINAGSPYMSEKLLLKKLSQGKFAK